MIRILENLFVAVLVILTVMAGGVTLAIRAFFKLTGAVLGAG